MRHRVANLLRYIAHQLDPDGKQTVLTFNTAVLIRRIDDDYADTPEWGGLG
jgi:hypothetical protein